MSSKCETRECTENFQGSVRQTANCATANAQQTVNVTTANWQRLWGKRLTHLHFLPHCHPDRSGGIPLGAFLTGSFDFAQDDVQKV